MVRLPVFQMKLGLDASSRPGWIFADEGQDEAASMAFVIPLLPLHPFDRVELSLAGERAGKFTEFTLVFNGHTFVEARTAIRFALHDIFAPTDLRGLPFANSFPYIGTHFETLDWYGLSAGTSFMPVSPLDLDRMDLLFVEQRIIFSGTTFSYGLHRETNSKPWPSLVTRVEDPIPSLAEAEKDLFIRALGRANGNRSVAAGLLKVSRATLNRKLKEYGLAESHPPERGMMRRLS
jgi:hypothetical protein